MAISISVARGAAYPAYGGRRTVPATVTPDTSYPAGGWAVTPGSLGARVGSVEGMYPTGGDAEAGQFQLLFNPSTVKIMAFRGSQVRTFAPGGGDVKGATNPAGTEGTADQNSAPVNSGLYKAAATVTSLAGTITPTTQPAIPRNVMITVTNDSGGALNLYEGTTTFTITGTDVNGAALTETVALTSTSGNKSVANTKYRYVQGVKPFKTITSVTYDNAAAGNLKLSLGPGTRIGLPAKLSSGAHTDVLNISVNAAPVTAGSTVANAGGVDTTNNAVNVGTIADGDDLSFTYRDSGEVTTGEDISFAVFKVNFIVKS